MCECVWVGSSDVGKQLKTILARGLEVDGGVGPKNAYKVIEAGANAIVAGSAVFGAPDYAEAIKGIKTSQRPLAVAA